MKSKTLLAALWVAGLTACETVSSGSVSTDGLYASYGVEAQGDGASTVRARLKVGGSTSNTNLELEPGDQLQVTYGGTTVDLLGGATVAGGASYTASVPTDADGTEFDFAFLRDAGTSAPSSVVTLPAPYTVSAPSAGATISLEAGFDLTWSNADDDTTFSWSLLGDCFEFVSAEIEDSGAERVPGGASQFNSDATVGSCNGTLELRRTRLGSVDPAFGEGGRVEAIHKRQVGVVVTP